MKTSRNFSSFALIISILFLTAGCTGGIGAKEFEPFSAACNGESFPEAAEFAGGISGPVPVVMFDVADEENPRGVFGLGEEWTPANSAEVQLVVCKNDEDSLSLICPDGSMLVGLAGTRVDVIEARTGMRVYGIEVPDRYTCGNGDSDHYGINSKGDILDYLREALAGGHIQAYHPPLEFNPYEIIMEDSNGSLTYLRIPSHGFIEGQELMYYNLSPGQHSDLYPLVHNQAYYVRYVDADTLQLLSDPESENPIQFLPPGENSGVHAFNAIH